MTSVLIGVVAGVLVTFLLTSGRAWWRRRRLAKNAAKQLAPQLDAVNAAVSDALSAYSWEPLERLELTDHSVPRLTMTVIDGLPRRAAEPFTDGVAAIHELDQARISTALVAPHERDRVESYRRRVELAAAIAATAADHRS